MLGFAILMTGMQMMSGAVSPLRESPMFIKMLTMFSNPIAGILVGIALLRYSRVRLQQSVCSRLFP